MNRRELLLATTGALASAASGSALGMSGSSLVPLLGAASSAASVGAACALIPVQPVARATAGMRELCVKRFFPPPGLSCVSASTTGLPLRPPRAMPRAIASSGE